MNDHFGHPISILLAEDNEDHALITIDSLRENCINNDVTHKENGKLAIEFLKACPEQDLPNLIMLDIKMPLNTGYDVLEFIRSTKRLKHLPVVMISTTQDDGEIKKAYSMGANSFISKPVEFQRFSELIKEFNFYWTVTATLPSHTPCDKT